MSNGALHESGGFRFLHFVFFCFFIVFGFLFSEMSFKDF